jgi:CRISPR-associated protein Csb1
MSDEQIQVNRFDDWLKEGSRVAALVMREWLEPVEGKDAVIFPPTYAKPERTREEDWLGYNIDRFDGGANVCLIDSVGSQANRMEPVFKRIRLEPIFKRERLDYHDLVPQVIIKAGKREIHLLDAGHRAGDAIARFADKAEGASGADSRPLGAILWDAFKAWQEFGDAEPLARIAPTSLVFGAWDSRATQAKLPRIVRSVLRAYNVKTLTRSAQFSTPLHYVDEGLIAETLDKGEGEKNPLSQEGFRHSPAAGSHGGVEVMDDIRRDVSLNLVALRSLGVKGKPDESPGQVAERMLKLRRYVLGLALVALMNRDEQMFNLREGCLLRVARTSGWKIVPFEGKEEEKLIDHRNALEYAQKAATDFKVQPLDNPFLFNHDKAEKWLKLSKDERDKRRRQGPVINEQP